MWIYSALCLGDLVAYRCSAALNHVCGVFCPGVPAPCLSIVTLPLPVHMVQLGGRKSFCDLALVCPNLVKSWMGVADAFVCSSTAELFGTLVARIVPKALFVAGPSAGELLVHAAGMVVPCPPDVCSRYNFELQVMSSGWLVWSQRHSSDACCVCAVSIERGPERRVASFEPVVVVMVERSERKGVCQRRPMRLIINCCVH